MEAPHKNQTITELCCSFTAMGKRNKIKTAVRNNLFANGANNCGRALKLISTSHETLHREQEITVILDDVTHPSVNAESAFFISTH